MTSTEAVKVRALPWSGVLARLSPQHRAGLRSISWSYLAQGLGMVIRLGSTLVLTRLLAPDAYGVLGSAMAVITTLEWLSDLGIQPALVRHARGEARHYLDTGWSMGVGRGLFLALTTAMLAWPLSTFYHQPELLGVLAVLALRPALMAFRSPGLPLLRRQLNYRALFIDELAQTVFGTVVSVALGWWWRSAWAIVGGTLTGAVTALVVSYLLCPYRPSLRWDPKAARDIRHLGAQVFVNTLLMALWLNSDRLLGLRFISSEAMGCYAVAWNLASAAEGLITRTCDVYYSVLCRLPEGEGQKCWHDRVFACTAWLGMPLLALLVPVGPLLVRLLYDPRYAPAGLILAVMLTRLMVRTLGQVQFQYLLARARVHLASYAYGVALAVQVVCFLPLVLNWGAVGLALSGLLSTAALTAFQGLLIAREFQDRLTPLGITLACATAALGVAFLLS